MKKITRYALLSLDRGTVGPVMYESLAEALQSLKRMGLLEVKFDGEYIPIKLDIEIKAADLQIKTEGENHAI